MSLLLEKFNQKLIDYYKRYEIFPDILFLSKKTVDGLLDETKNTHKLSILDKVQPNILGYKYIVVNDQEFEAGLQFFEENDFKNALKLIDSESVIEIDKSTEGGCANNMINGKYPCYKEPKNYSKLILRYLIQEYKNYQIN